MAVSHGPQPVFVGECAKCLLYFPKSKEPESNLLDLWKNAVEFKGANQI